MERGDLKLTGSDSNSTQPFQSRRSPSVTGFIASPNRSSTLPLKEFRSLSLGFLPRVWSDSKSCTVLLGVQRAGFSSVVLLEEFIGVVWAELSWYWRRILTVVCNLVDFLLSPGPTPRGGISKIKSDVGWSIFKRAVNEPIFGIPEIVANWDLYFGEFLTSILFFFGCCTASLHKK